MITAPICEFVRRYRYSGALRMHMPGHKGTALLGPEPLDLTEIEGADVLYHAEGIIRESEANAAALFGTKKTVYSAEGSSLCIRSLRIRPTYTGSFPASMPAQITKSPSLRQGVTHTRSS